MKKSKLIVLFVGIAFLVVILYAVKLRSVGAEGNKIYEERCLNVNPHLIAYKQSFLDFADAAKSFKESDGADYLVKYINEMKLYVPEENKWIEKQEKYISSWGFTYLMPDFMKQAAFYQLEMYKAYRDEAQILTGSIDKKGLSEDFVEKFKEARERKAKYVNLYNELYTERSAKFDIRMIFISQPTPSGCTKENTIIPSTSGALDE